MNDIKHHVDYLFRSYKHSHNINDLKAEILSNLEAKRSDLIADGYDETTATKQAIESIDNIDYLIDGNKNIWIHQLQVEALQHLLLYLTIAWVITIPLCVFTVLATRANIRYVSGVIIAGILYLIMRSNKNATYINSTRYVTINRFKTASLFTWAIWGIYFISQEILVTATHFGSNLWFGHSLKIGGPYVFAQIVTDYLIPLSTILIPLIVSKLPKLIEKYEVGEYES